MLRSIAGKTSIDEEFWTSALWVLDEAGIRGARGYFAVCPSVPGAVSSAVRRGSKADPAGPAFGKKHQSLVIRVFCVPCQRSCRPPVLLTLLPAPLVGGYHMNEIQIRPHTPTMAVSIQTTVSHFGSGSLLGPISYRFGI